MSERLTDEQVAKYAALTTELPMPREVGSLAREVQWWRADDVLDALTINDLCARHGITVEGIVALVDDLFDPRSLGDFWTAHLRRLARQEDGQ